MGEVRFMISEAAKKVEVESHVLRYWEEELNLTIGRTEMGHRYYTDDDIQLFRCIKKLKDEGMLLRDLKPLIPELKETRLKLRSSGNESPASDKSDQSEPKTDHDKAELKAVPDDTDTADNIMISLNRADQMRSLIGNVFREALTENNDVLKKDISSTVTADVMHEMDFLLQAKERQQEEHFRRLDTLIRQQQANRRETARVSPLGKLKKIFT
ncbi:helix-turn-helix domain-containing protein [Ruminococcus sp. CLA-AA-H200]|uniref:Helix-turn-helix domain-containing protein n=1 Tax=Ruminococcus turbiniformis TaxID=2881258 RepID=A0ABS8FSC2_9FIRM|nr:helix-turn-helix domain-containing protein [Ruminococcus turbiniformis]MCC2252872.1 helix-turn-helix domain-containing protein [Ruminococcus turbiniformis]